MHEDADLVAIGRAAIATADWPSQAEDDLFKPQAFPMTPQTRHTAGISETFLNYLNTHGLVKSCIANFVNPPTLLKFLTYQL